MILPTATKRFIQKTVGLCLLQLSLEVNSSVSVDSPGLQQEERVVSNGLLVGSHYKLIFGCQLLAMVVLEGLWSLCIPFLNMPLRICTQRISGSCQDINTK